MESTKLENKLVIVPSTPGSEELLLDIIAIVTVSDPFLICWDVEFKGGVQT